MKTSNGFRIWRIACPVLVYYIVSELVYFALELSLGTETQNYMQKQLLCAAATIPFTLVFYREDGRAASEKQSLKQNVMRCFCAALGGASLGIAVNNVLAMTPLIGYSKGFQTANAAFFAGSVAFELLGSCLVIPIAEELLFRGVVFRRLRLLVGGTPAVVCSALLFGVMHFNLVQFLYASALGLFLAWLYARTGRLSAAVLAHMAANLAAVVRTETGFLSFGFVADARGILFTAAMAAVFAGALFLLRRERENT